PRKRSTTELREPVPPTDHRDAPSRFLFSTPTGNRTPVSALRTRRPRPLDDGGKAACHGERDTRRWHALHSLRRSPLFLASATPGGGAPFIASAANRLSWQA